MTSFRRSMIELNGDFIYIFIHFIFCYFQVFLSCCGRSLSCFCISTSPPLRLSFPTVFFFTLFFPPSSNPINFSNLMSMYANIDLIYRGARGLKVFLFFFIETSKSFAFSTVLRIEKNYAVPQRNASRAYFAKNKIDSAG